MPDSTDPIRIELIEFLSTIARPGRPISDVADDVNLIDVGLLDSLALIQIISYLEQHHSLNLQSHGIDPNDLGSIEGIVQAIEKSTG